MATFGFNPAEVPPQEDFTPLPAGEYMVVAIKSDIEPTKNGGSQMVFHHQVLDGPYKGRLIFDRITLTNVNAQAQEIGRRSISALCHAVGKPGAQESAELHNKPFIIRVAIEKNDTYGDRNNVKGYKSCTGAKPAVATVAQPAATTTTTTSQPEPAPAPVQQQATSDQATRNRPSWMNKSAAA